MGTHEARKEATYPIQSSRVVIVYLWSCVSNSPPPIGTSPFPLLSYSPSFSVPQPTNIHLVVKQPLAPRRVYNSDKVSISDGWKLHLCISNILYRLSPTLAFLSQPLPASLPDGVY